MHTAIHEQSADINQGVDRANPGRSTRNDDVMLLMKLRNMPLALDLSHKLLQELAILDVKNEILICVQMLNPK
jgi:S-adenosylmethionine synthetase